MRSRLKEERNCEIAEPLLTMLEVNPDARWSAAACNSYLEVPPDTLATVAPTQKWDPDAWLPPTQRGAYEVVEEVYEKEEVDKVEEVQWLPSAPISARTRRKLKRPLDERPTPPIQQRRASREQSNYQILTEERLGYAHHAQHLVTKREPPEVDNGKLARERRRTR